MSGLVGSLPGVDHDSIAFLPVGPRTATGTAPACRRDRIRAEITEFRDRCAALSRTQSTAQTSRLCSAPGIGPLAIMPLLRLACEMEGCSKSLKLCRKATAPTLTEHLPSKWRRRDSNPLIPDLQTGLFRSNGANWRGDVAKHRLA